MVRSDTQQSPSIYSGITWWASHARPLPLVLLTGLGLAGVVAVLVVDWHRWPLACLFFTASTVGAWGLLDQKTKRPHSRPVLALERVLVGLGVLSALMGSLAVFFWLLGPAPIL